MTALLLLGVVARDAPLPPSTAPYIGASVGDMRAIRVDVDPSEGRTPDGIASWAQRQNAILCDIASGSDVLPVKLGAVFSTETAMQEHLARQSPHMLAAMQALAGRCQYDLCVRSAARPAPASERPERGAAFLAQRRAHRDARNARSSRIRAFIGTLVDVADGAAVDARADVRQPEGRLLRRAYLVGRGEVAAFTTTIAAAAEAAQSLGLCVSLTGPLPPFAFLDQTEPCLA